MMPVVFFAQIAAGLTAMLSWQKVTISLVPTSYYPGNSFKRYRVKSVKSALSSAKSRGDIGHYYAAGGSTQRTSRKTSQCIEHHRSRVTYLGLNNQRAPPQQADLCLGWSTDYQV